jgi:hypothetical protein
MGQALAGLGAAAGGAASGGGLGGLLGALGGGAGGIPGAVQGMGRDAFLQQLGVGMLANNGWSAAPQSMGALMGAALPGAINAQQLAMLQGAQNMAGIQDSQDRYRQRINDRYQRWLEAQQLSGLGGPRG